MSTSAYSAIMSLKPTGPRNSKRSAGMPKAAKRWVNTSTAPRSLKLGALSNKREPGTCCRTWAHRRKVRGVSLGTLLKEPKVKLRSAWACP